MRPLTKNIIFNIHPASLLLSAGSVLAGLAASVLRGGVVLFPAIMTLLCAMLFQISANLYYGYRKVRSISDDGQLEARGIDPNGYLVMKALSNVCAILAVTMALPLFIRLRWISVIYIIFIVALTYYQFAGPRPLVRTRWSVVMAFVLFGPLAVSGTALIQNRFNPDWSPILVYSAVSGLLAVNAHLCIQYLRKVDNVRDGMTSLLASSGHNVVRFLYMADLLIVGAIFALCPGDFGFDSRWIGLILAVWLLSLGVIAFRLMKNDDAETALKLRLLVITQYVSCMIALLCIVLVSMDGYWFTMLTVK